MRRRPGHKIVQLAAVLGVDPPRPDQVAQQPGRHENDERQDGALEGVRVLGEEAENDALKIQL